MFKSVGMACYKKAAFWGLDKGRQKVMLHLGGRANDQAVGIGRMVATDDDRLNGAVVVQACERGSIPILLMIDFTSR